MEPQLGGRTDLSGELTAQCQAVGLDRIDDTDELVGQQFAVLVRVQKGTGGYEDRNVIKGFAKPAEKFRDFSGAGVPPLPEHGTQAPPEPEILDDDIPF